MTESYSQGDKRSQIITTRPLPLVYGEVAEISRRKKANGFMQFVFGAVFMLVVVIGIGVWSGTTHG